MHVLDLSQGNQALCMCWTSLWGTRPNTCAGPLSGEPGLMHVLDLSLGYQA
ncbi:hypothetical protein DPMN_077344 [Dreissena polymorpha]|uniref:Uncharacterized protein n=1 Tax=Dreissena polymorpha TaxID=45954 RepID=A0A9D4BGJ7_DREPO|nr:hypothetical protein DPMN_077344 [Dreissena polymorpha]